MNRLPDWERRLGAYISRAASESHSYGRHDCMLHCAAAIEAVTGEDHGRGHRGKYRTAAGALRHLKAAGFDSPEAMLDSLFEEVPVGFAQRGDVALTPANDAGEWNLPGVVVGDIALCASERGLAAEPRPRWLKAWKVGR